MSKDLKVNEIVDFVAKHPQTIASRRICREVLGEALDRFNEEFAAELESQLQKKDELRIDSYYSLIR
jgi:hypothetical protein